MAELVSDSDDNLFKNVLNNENYALHKLLPERSTHDYYLRPIDLMTAHCVSEMITTTFCTVRSRCP